MKLKVDDVAHTLEMLAHLKMTELGGRRVAAHLLLASLIVRNTDDAGLAAALDQMLESEFHGAKLIDEIIWDRGGLAQFIKDHPNAAAGMGDKPHAEWQKMQEMADEELEESRRVWSLCYCERIGHPVNSDNFTEEYCVLQGTKTECRKFAEKFNSIRAVWTLRRQDDTVFLNINSPKAFIQGCEVNRGKVVDMCCHGKCQEITPGYLKNGNQVKCSVCGFEEEYEVAS